jgi:hypothetical protein
MAFRIKDLMVAIMPPEGAVGEAGCGFTAGCGGATFGGCGGITLPGCGGATFVGCGGATFVGCGGATFVGCGGATFVGCGGATFVGCGGATLVGCGAFSVGDCGNDPTCHGCTNTCDAGCSRIQCSDYPTNNIPAQQLQDLKTAELLRMRAEMRIAMQERAIGQSVATTPQQSLSSVEDIDRLEENLRGALDELAQERARRTADDVEDPPA